MTSFTHDEIFSQPDAWQAALPILAAYQPAAGDLFSAGKYDQVIYTGCGSTYYLALAAASLFTQLSGRPARGLPASELWLNPQVSYPIGQKILLVAISRSGETSETLQACQAFLSAGCGDLLTLSCYPQRPLAAMGKVNLCFPDSQENSVVQTRSFSTLYLAASALAALWAGRKDLLASLDRLPDAAQRLLERGAAGVAQLGADLSLDRFYFLGSGPRYGLASELSLKMKESSLSHSEPFHFMEFRHGPMSMITLSTLLVGLRSESNRASESQVLDEMQAKGARLLVMDEEDAQVAFASGVPEALRNVLYLPLGHVLAFERALAKGLDPDHPHNLDAVVKL